MENWGETMPKRTTCVPAMFAILFVALTLGPASAEPARDDCVANPNAAVPRVAIGITASIAPPTAAAGFWRLKV